MKIDLKIPYNTVIYCPTYESAQELFETLSRIGWKGDISLYDWKIHKEKMCYNLYRDMYSHIQYYEEQDTNIITSQEFINLHRNNNMNTKKYKVTRQQIKQIYDIACPQWQSHIEELMGISFEPFNNEGELSHIIVTRMFEEATSPQKNVLKEIFPEYDKNVYPLCTPMMCSNDGIDWYLRYKCTNKTVYMNGHKEEGNISFKFIVPVKDFNFEDAPSNIPKSL